MDRYIVGHVAPDWDCITALWLLQRFGGFAEAEIKLVNTGTPDPEVLAGAVAVVDTGRVLDIPDHRFDHHQLDDPNSTCAAMQVYKRIVRVVPALAYLEPLIALIYAGDTGKPEAAQSRIVGIHAQLSAWKARGLADELLIAVGYDVLDDLAAHLLRQHEARQTLDAHTVYRSADGLLVALEQSSRAAVQAAHDAGARLVLWHRTFEHTETVELWRGGTGPDVDCGKVVRSAIADLVLLIDERDELSSWYLHSAGFYAGRGSDKAPDARPLRASAAILAAYLDAAWERSR